MRIPKRTIVLEIGGGPQFVTLEELAARLGMDPERGDRLVVEMREGRTEVAQIAQGERVSG